MTYDSTLVGHCIYLLFYKIDCRLLITRFKPDNFPKETLKLKFKSRRFSPIIKGCRNDVLIAPVAAAFFYALLSIDLTHDSCQLTCMSQIFCT